MSWVLWVQVIWTQASDLLTSDCWPLLEDKTSISSLIHTGITGTQWTQIRLNIVKSDFLLLVCTQMICDYSEYEYYLVYIWNAHLFVNHWSVALFSPHNSYLLYRKPLEAKIAADCIVFLCVVSCGRTFLCQQWNGSVVFDLGVFYSRARFTALNMSTQYSSYFVFKELNVKSILLKFLWDWRHFLFHISEEEEPSDQLDDLVDGDDDNEAMDADWKLSNIWTVCHDVW